MKPHSFHFQFPAPLTPEWSSKVDRWYQLDAYAFGLAEGALLWSREFGALPSFVVLAAPEGSNEADFAFAKAGAANPTKFVHTLPNVRLAPFCQVLDWHGPALCLEASFNTAIEEGKNLLSAERKIVWVVAVSADKTKYLATAQLLEYKPASL